MLDSRILDGYTPTIKLVRGELPPRRGGMVESLGRETKVWNVGGRKARMVLNA